MTIKQALKLKNKLVKQIGENTGRLISYNTIEVGNKRPYDISEINDHIMSDIIELAELKAKIHSANLPVLGDIFKMSELKSIIKTYKQLSCSEGKTSSRYGTEVSYMESIITISDRDNIIKEIEDKIEEIQDRLDVFNATTEI